MAENQSSLPFVSVFVPARDEEASIKQCLHSLLIQDYAGPYEILVADDESSDRTFAIAEGLGKLHGHLRVFRLNSWQSETMRGKQRALALLTDEAKGEIYLFCDADMTMPSGWIRNMVMNLSRGNADLVNGTTTSSGDSAFFRLQALDWLIPQAAMEVLGRFGLAYTAMGNNMGLRRSVYESVGGYRGIPFSVTEDFELFRHLKRKGFHLRHIFHKNVLGITRPSQTTEGWFQQHLRWTKGFFQLSFIQQVPFYFLIIHLPLTLCLFGLNFRGFITTILAGLWALKLLWISSRLIKCGKLHLLIWLPLYEIVFPPVYFLLFFTSLQNKTIIWKGRQHKSKHT